MYRQPSEHGISYAHQVFRRERQTITCQHPEDMTYLAWVATMPQDRIIGFARLGNQLVHCLGRGGGAFFGTAALFA